MSMHDPSLDPQPTVDHLRPQQPDTVAVSQEVSTGATGPYVPAPPADAPTIPGYRITGLIARGGMGRVFAAFDETLEREVAIKTLLPGANAERFVTEAKITARLPHPGIPPVHALGTLEDGTPWLAMKLIRGQTLSELLKRRSSPKDDHSRYLQIFEQIAQAVGFAHARGVLHRDLKPLNVMVGELGEVQVMDWGLAKELTSRDREGAGDETNAAPLPGGLGSLEHTAAGTILGTPGYMAPEQARGEVVDARADVFALGSILATILTGKPAFVGTSKYETISKAANADLADVLARLDTCRADAELLAIARRCLAANAEERFADGREVASAVAAYRATVEARLRQAETAAAEALVREAEQRKRRRLAIAAGGSIAAVLLIGLAVSLGLMQRAVNAEGQARENEAKAVANAELAQANEAKAVAERDAKDVALQAEQKARAAERLALDRAKTALRSMTDEIVENQMARGTTLTEENKQFLRTILEQFEALAAVTGDDAESRAIRAEGLARVGLMRHRLGELQEAEAAWRDALALQKQLAADFPTRTDFRQELARSHNNLGILLRATGRLQEAEAAYRDALALQKQLAADFPTRPEFRQDLAGSHNNLGNLLRATGRLQEAEAAWRDALALQKQLAADFPNQPDLRNDLAGTLVNLAILHRQQKQWYAAKQRLDEGRPHHLAALKANPRHPTYRQFYRNHLGVRTEVQAGLLEPEEALRTAQTRRDTGWNPPADAYDAARALALCIPIVDKHEKLDADKRKEAVRFYGDEAMKLLRDAVAKGFKDAKHMKQDSDLAPLRDREDFQKMLAELEKLPEQKK